MKKIKALIDFNDLEKNLFVKAGEVIERDDARANEILAAKVDGQAFAEEVVEGKAKQKTKAKEEAQKETDAKEAKKK